MIKLIKRSPPHEVVYISPGAIESVEAHNNVTNIFFRNYGYTGAIEVMESPEEVYRRIIANDDRDAARVGRAVEHLDEVRICLRNINVLLVPITLTMIAIAIALFR